MDNSITKELRQFQVRNERLSTYYVSTTAFLGYLSIFLAVVSFKTFPLATFLLYPIVFALLCRSIVLMHDAGHNSLYKKKWLNSVSGNLMGILCLIPVDFFSYLHHKHHASTGNLEKRDINPELKTMTVNEYEKSSKTEKWVYRLMRSGFTRFILIPIILLVVTRIPLPILNLRGKLAALTYNVRIGVLLFVSIKFGFLLSLIFGYFIPLFACYALVTIVFYLQHQFEDTLWLKGEDWNNYDASFEGSSYLKMGKLMNLITINIGYHHIHHMNPNIPGYYLSKAPDYIKDSISFKEVRISEVFRHMRSKLWDDKTKKLIHYSEIDGYKNTI